MRGPLAAKPRANQGLTFEEDTNRNISRGRRWSRAGATENCRRNSGSAGRTRCFICCRSLVFLAARHGRQRQLRRRMLREDGAAYPRRAEKLPRRPCAASVAGRRGPAMRPAQPRSGIRCGAQRSCATALKLGIAAHAEAASERTDRAMVRSVKRHPRRADQSRAQHGDHRPARRSASHARRRIERPAIGRQRSRSSGRR